MATNKFIGSLLEELKNWLASLHFRKSLKVSRNIMIYSGDKVEFQLHHFTDASETSYGAVSYVCIATCDNVVCAFLFGKGKVAPLKGVSIP